MQVILGIDTSTRTYGIALQGGAEQAVESAAGWEERSSTPLASMLTRGLGRLDAAVGDIAMIAVNIGPGRLTSVRSGVAFANALAYSLGVPLIGADSFFLLGRSAARQTPLPVVCAFPGPEGKTYVGLYRDGRVQTARLGILEQVAPEVVPRSETVALAGRSRRRLIALLPPETVVDTEIESVDPQVLIEYALEAGRAVDAPFTPLRPLNEQSEVFR